MSSLARCLGAVAFLSVNWTFASAQSDVKNGEYLAKAAGCAGCHTASGSDAAPFAGGRELITPFGTFYGPNITPHAAAGIGRWVEADFVTAMRHGIRPDGAHYFPSFPYPSFTKIVDADLNDLWAYLRSLPANATPSKEHELRFPFNYRILLWGWKWLFFTPGDGKPVASPKSALGRGAYLTEALGHCGECHTPRNFLGGPRKGRHLAGAKLPEGRTPNLTPTRLKRWNDKQLADFLRTGATPEGDAPSDVMDEVIRNTTSQLKPEDLTAMIAYLRSLPPLPDESKSN